MRTAPTVICVCFAAAIGVGCGESDPTIPKVVGDTEADAVQTLALAGYGTDVQQKLEQTGVVGGPSVADCPHIGSSAARGRVVEQAPAAGLNAPKGFRVSILTCVSIGRWEPIPEEYSDTNLIERSYPAPK